MQWSARNVGEVMIFHVGVNLVFARLFLRFNFDHGKKKFCVIR
jgi:hypothetical protein